METYDENFLYYLDLHYFILKQKFLYYYGVGYGFKTIPDEDYDVIEQEYKRVCHELGKPPVASEMVGWDRKWIMAPFIEALAMRDSNKELYERIKDTIFVFK